MFPLCRYSRFVQSEGANPQYGTVMKAWPRTKENHTFNTNLLGQAWNHRRRPILFDLLRASIGYHVLHVG